jgi:hypothetical protein
VLSTSCSSHLDLKTRQLLRLPSHTQAITKFSVILYMIERIYEYLPMFKASVQCCLLTFMIFGLHWLSILYFHAFWVWIFHNMNSNLFNIWKYFQVTASSCIEQSSSTAVQRKNFTSLSVKQCHVYLLTYAYIYFIQSSILFVIFYKNS